MLDEKWLQLISIQQLNASYDSVHRIDAANGLSADFHEFYVTPNGTALITMFELVEFNLSQFPGYESASNKSPPSYIWDCLFQEISIDTGGLVFEWRASDHVSVSQTYRRINTQGTRNNPFDWFHINSVQKDEAGHYLISSRYTHSIMYIDGESGAIIWTLGGKGNDFADLSNGNAINFAWQHDARLLPRETFPNMYIASIVPDGLTTKLLTLFDNAADDDSDDYGLPHSRGLVLELIYPARRSNIKYPRQTTHSTCPRRRGVVSDLNAQKIREINGSDPDHTVRVVQSYESPEGTRTHSQGSLQVLPSSDGQDPKILIGWGRNAAWTEYEVNGTILCNAHYGFNVSAGRGDVQNYRIYKMPWIGTPQTRPSGKISENDAEVYVSWNGATDVVQWSLQCSKSDSANDGDWREIARVKKEGFETVIPLSAEVSQSRFLRVIAISENEQRFEFGTTKTMRRSFIATHLPWLSHLLPYKISHSWPLAVLLFMVGAISLTLALYGLARSILRWRSGHVRSSRFNRRNRPVYQPIGRE